MRALLHTVNIILLWTLLHLHNTHAGHNEREHSARNPSSLRRQRPIVKNNTNLGNANLTTDVYLEIIKSTLLRKEPLELESVRSCSKCVLRGVSTIRRRGSATVYDLDEDIKRVKITVDFPSINVTCLCSFGYFVYVSGQVNVSVTDLYIYLDVVSNLITEQSDVHRIRVTHPGQVEVVFDGYGILSNIVDKFTFLFKSTMTNKVRQCIYNELPRVIREEHSHHLYRLGYLKK